MTIPAVRRSGGPGRPSRWVWTLLPLGATVVGVLTANARNLPVVIPLLATVWVAALFYVSLRGGERTAVVEVGSVYAAIVTLYGVFPLLGYLANGLEYTPANDLRLFLAQPRPQEIAATAWLYVVYLAAFSVAYRLARGRVRFRAEAFPRPGRARTITLVVLLCLVIGYFWALGRVFDLSAVEYTESYLVYSRLPLLIGQITNHVGGMRFTLEVALLAILFADFRRYRWLIGAALVGEAVLTFVRLGSRTEFVLLWMAAAILFHWLVRPVSERSLVGAGSLVVGLFLAFGVLRSGVLETRVSAGWNVFAYTNEFEGIFGNAYEVAHLKADGSIGSLPIGFYLTDLFALVPQQLLPVAKMNPADWYATTFYPDFAAQGGGLAFGTLCESILVGGVWGTVLRAGLLGVVLAIVHRWCSRRRASFWPMVIYLWLILQGYQAFRSTTFCLLAYFVYRVVPVIVLVEAAHLLSRPTRIVARSSGFRPTTA